MQEAAVIGINDQAAAGFFFATGVAGMALMSWEGYAILTRRTTISRWMANLLKVNVGAFAGIEATGAAVWVLLLLHFIGALPFWTP